MKAVHRGAPGRPDLHSLLDAAGVLAAELRQLRGHFEALTATYERDWVERELAGYPAGATIPRYRQVPCAIWGELASPAGATEVALLPTAHLNRGDRAVISGGIDHPEQLAGRDGAAGAFLRDIDPQQHALYLRGMPPQRSGWRLLQAWECVPLASLLQMVRDIGEYARVMHREAVRRQRPSTGSRAG
jgi:hypothetical protein